jgi:regulation of enolase protein 1 (concanavalin A-like superfamily)
MEDAEALFRQTIALARKMGAPDREVVRLHYWLGEVLYWQSRFDELIALGEEGLALLGEDTESAEAALMNLWVASGHQGKGNEEKWVEFTRRNAAFVLRLPYWEECLAVYDHIVHVYAEVEKDLAEAMRWVQALQQMAEEHRDLRSLYGVHDQTGWLLRWSGDFPGAISAHRQLLELCARTGNPPLTGWTLWYLLDHYLTLGNLPRAEELVPRLQENNQQFGRIDDRARSSLAIGRLRLCQGRPDEAAGAFQEAAHLYREIGPPQSEATAAQALGRVYLAQGRRPAAWAQFEAAMVLTGQATAELLGDLEAAADQADSFHRFCRRFRAEHPEAGASSPVQWYLERAEPIGVLRIPYSVSGRGGPVFDFAEYELRDTQYAPLDSGSVWQDPFGDCSFTVQNGLEIHAANGRDLWQLNLSAPRLLRHVAGEFAMQTVCVPLTADQPAMGGILLWKGKENFLRLDRGTRGPHEVSFQGCLGNQDVIIGRGHLPAERVILRLERLGPRVRALCSADGQEWFTVGHAEFPVEDPLEVGVHAIGAIDRTLYPGPYPEGTAIRFESFQLLG